MRSEAFPLLYGLVMLLIVLLILPFSAFCSSIIQVSSLDKARSSLENATANDLIVFDVDNTLLVADDKILRPCGEKYFVEHFIGLFKMLPTDRVEHLASRILMSRTYTALDEWMPELVQQLQTRSVKIIAFTTYNSGKYGAIKSMEEWRRKELLAVGFDFSRSFPHTNHIVFGDMMLGTSLPVYKDGILFSADMSKGDILQAFLRRVKWRPQKVIFVDDNKEHIESVHLALTSAGIECLCIHYCNQKLADETLDKEFADRQFHHLRAYGEWKR